MNRSTASFANSSFLLWGLGLLVAVLGAQVVLGWIRQGQHEAPWRSRWQPLVLAALTLGTALCAAMVLSLSAEGLPFKLGFRGLSAAGLWAAAVLASLPLAVLLAHSQRWPATLAGGSLLAVLATAVQAGWIWAAGFRPGVTWSNEFNGMAAVLTAIAFVTALRVAYSSASNEDQNRRLWRLGAALILGLALVAGQEIVKAGTDLAKQVGSVYAREVPATVLSLVAGVAVPLGLALMAFDLYLRDRAHRRRRRKRRHRSTRPAPLRDRQS